MRTLPLDKKVIFIASRRETNKYLKENFKDYLEKQTTSNHNLTLEVQIATPDEEKSLQVADFVYWAIFRKYERGDETYQ